MEVRQKVFKMHTYDLSKKVALITGAGGLLGIQHAIALFEVNANVVLTDININALKKQKAIIEKKFNKNCLIYKLDVTNKSSIQKVIKDLTKKNIFVDILINNAAIDPKINKKSSSRLENFDLRQWNIELSVGLTGAFLCTQLFCKEMNKKKKGVILNIASDLSVIAPDQRIYMQKGIAADKQGVKPVTYSVIKHGLIGLTKYTAAYYADKNIRCNAISPGGIYNNQNKKFVNKLRKLIPMSRMANKDEYKAAIQFLCSDASSYMTGQNLIIDGGRSII